MINHKENKPIILCLVGRSGCGKTTASLWLQKHFSDVNTIVSHTTRPIRYGETDGVEHWFAKDHRKDIPPKSKMLAYTKFGGYEYWAELSDIKQDKINVYVIDEKGINGLIKDHGDKFDIFICQIIRPGNDGADEARLKRDKDREPLLIDYPHWMIYNDKMISKLYKYLSIIFLNINLYKSGSVTKKMIFTMKEDYWFQFEPNLIGRIPKQISPKEFERQYMGNFEKQEDEKESRRDSHYQ